MVYRMPASVSTFFPNRTSTIFRAALRIGGCAVLLLVMTHQAAHAFAATTPHKNKACVVADLNFDGSTDLEALDEQQIMVAALLKQEKFKELDCSPF
jgi:hypothetical protein